MFSLLVIFAVLAATSFAQHDPNYCYVTDPIRSQLNRFSSRTAYETIRGRTINPNVSGKFHDFAKVNDFATIRFVSLHAG